MGASSYSTVHKGRGVTTLVYQRVGREVGPLAERDGTSGMLALIYMFAIWCVASVLYVTVNEYEPNPRLALALKFLVLVVGAAAIASRLAP
jgi:hypothetical protein